MLNKKTVFKVALGSLLMASLMVLFSASAFAAPRTPHVSGCVPNGATIVDVTGTIPAGATSTISSGTNMDCVKTIAVTAKNKAGSVSALTFFFTQHNCGITGCVDVLLGSIRVTPNTTNFASFSTSPAGLTSTLTITATADPGNGVDNFRVTVQAFTS